MAYWDAKLLVLTATPNEHNSQPTGFPGLREATKAPTVASITTSALPSHQSKTGASGSEALMARSTRLDPVNPTAIAHSDHASRDAAWALIRASPHFPASSSTARRAPAARSPAPRAPG